MIDSFILAQLIGMIVLAINVYSFQKKYSHEMLKIHTLANLTGILHFILLGQPVGVALICL